MSHVAHVSCIMYMYHVSCIMYHVGNVNVMCEADVMFRCNVQMYHVSCSCRSCLMSLMYHVAHVSCCSCLMSRRGLIEGSAGALGPLLRRRLRAERCGQPSCDNTSSHSKRGGGNQDGSSGTGQSPARCKARGSDDSPIHLRGSPPCRPSDNAAGDGETCSPTGSATARCGPPAEEVSSRCCARVRLIAVKIGAPEHPGRKLDRGIHAATDVRRGPSPPH